MSNQNQVWVDEQRCVGCGKCVQACPVGAIAINHNMALIDDAVCTGCGACIEACPEEAIQFVLEGQVVAVEAPAVPSLRQTGAVPEVTRPPASAVGAVVLGQVAGAVVREAGRWLAQVARHGASSLGKIAGDCLDDSTQRPRGSGSGAGHRQRHRRGRR